MISIFPLPTCPVCDYSLVGHPKGGRCPECGFEWDEYTVVFRPSRKWKAYVGALIYGLFACWYFGPRVFAVGHFFSSPFLAITIPCLMIISILGSVLLFAWLNPRRPCAIAITSSGLLIRHRYKHRKIPFEDLGMIAVFDAPATIKTKADKKKIALHGFFDSKHECRAFKAAISFAHSRLTEAGKERGPEDEAALHEKTLADLAEIQAIAEAPDDSTKLIKRPLTWIGVGMFLVCSAGFVLSVSPNPNSAIRAAVAKLSGWGCFAGVAIALYDQWNSDKRRRR